MNPSLPRTPFGPALAGARTVTDLGFEVAGDYGDPSGEYQATVERAGIVDRSTRGLVAVTGGEAGKFLHSLLSQDVDGLGDGRGVHTLLLQPQGKLTADLRLFAVGDEFWLDCEAGVAEALATALNRFRIRIDAVVEDRSDTSGCLTVIGPDAADVVEGAAGVTPGPVANDHVGWGKLRVVRAGIGPQPAFDIIGPVVDLEGAWTATHEAGAARVGTTAYEARRIESGQPRQGLDIDDRTIPQEAFLERDAVSFTKGCFLGQELVCRIDTRGHVNRYLRGIRLLDAVEPPTGAEVIAGDKVIGAVSSVASSPGQRATVALATVRREFEPPQVVELRWDGGAARAELVELPMVPLAV